MTQCVKEMIFFLKQAIGMSKVRKINRESVKIVQKKSSDVKKNCKRMLFFSECTEVIPVKQLPPHTACILSKSCSAIKCCTDIGVLNSTVQTEIDVDRCRGKLFIRIEKLETVIMLTDFEFSKWQKQSIQNVFSVE